MLEQLYTHAPAIGIITTLILALVWSGAAQKPLARWGAGAFESFVLIDQTNATALPHYLVCIGAGIAFMVGIGLLDELYRSTPKKRQQQPTIDDMFDFEEIR